MCFNLMRQVQIPSVEVVIMASGPVLFETLGGIKARLDLKGRRLVNVDPPFGHIVLPSRKRLYPYNCLEVFLTATRLPAGVKAVREFNSSAIGKKAFADAQRKFEAYLTELTNRGPYPGRLRIDDIATLFEIDASTVGNWHRNGSIALDAEGCITPEALMKRCSWHLPT